MTGKQLIRFRWCSDEDADTEIFSVFTIVVCTQCCITVVKAISTAVLVDVYGLRVLLL